MTRLTRLSAEAQVVADELVLLRTLGTRRRRASWKMVLDRQAPAVAAPERRQATAETRVSAKGRRLEQ